MRLFSWGVLEWVGISDAQTLKLLNSKTLKLQNSPTPKFVLSAVFPDVSSIMVTVRNYQDLIVWQKSLEFTIAIYTSTKLFPKEETYGLISQMRRAAVSISSNIAEGQTRHTVKQFFQFLSIARSSVSELETQIILSYRLNYINENKKKELLASAEEIGKMLSSLMKTLTKPKNSPTP